MIPEAWTGLDQKSVARVASSMTVAFAIFKTESDAATKNTIGRSIAGRGASSIKKPRLPRPREHPIPGCVLWIRATSETSTFLPFAMSAVTAAIGGKNGPAREGAESTRIDRRISTGLDSIQCLGSPTEVLVELLGGRH